MAMSKNIEIDLSSEHVQREMGNAVRRFLEHRVTVKHWFDAVTEYGLRVWLRICLVAVSALGLVVLVKLIFWPDSISSVIELIEFMISSGRGFAIPAVVFVTLLPRLLQLSRRAFGGEPKPGHRLAAWRV